MIRPYKKLCFLFTFFIVRNLVGIISEILKILKLDLDNIITEKPNQQKIFDLGPWFIKNRLKPELRLEKEKFKSKVIKAVELFISY